MAVRRVPERSEPERLVARPVWLDADDETFAREYQAVYGRLVAGVGSRVDAAVRHAALPRRVAMMLRDRRPG